MKKWETDNIQKVHNKKLQNVKGTIRPSLKHPISPRPISAPQVNDLAKVLSEFGLSKFTKVISTQKLLDLKYPNTRVLSDLSQSEFAQLLKRLQVDLHDSEKFKKMFDHIKSSSLQENERVNCRTASNLTSTTTVSIRKNSTGPASISVEKVETNKKLTKELELARQKIEELELELYRRKNQPIQLQKKLPVEMSRDSFFETPLAFEECKMPNLHDKDLGKSFDSLKMRSTLVNLDLEELCRCLARAILNNLANQPVLGQRFMGLRHRLSELFNEESTVPDENSIYYYVKNLVVRGQLEYEVPIVSLVYLERLVDKSGIRLSPQNWKKIIFIVFVEASKVWDDESFENNSFALAFSNHTIQEINRIEAAFLTLIDYQLKVSSSEYAQAYFILRTYAQDKDRSFPLKALDVDVVLKLQHNSDKKQEEVNGQMENLAKSI